MRPASLFCSLIILFLVAYALNARRGGMIDLYGKPDRVKVMSGGYAFVQIR